MQQLLRKHALFLAACLVSSLLAAPRAEAVALWPTGSWNAMTVGGAGYTDPLGDENPDPADIVGGDDGTGGFFGAGYWFQSEIDDQISLRMRVDADGSGSNSVWQFLFDTDNDITTVDWVLEVRQSGNPSGRQVILTSTTTGGPTYGDIALSSTFSWTGGLADWSRWGAVDDGSAFDGDTDYFLDVAMPLSAFQSITSPTAFNGFRVAVSSSTSHTQVNKDIPLGDDPTDPVSGGFSDLITNAPEPGTAVLTGLGLCLLGLRSPKRRRGRAARG